MEATRTSVKESRINVFLEMEEIEEIIIQAIAKNYDIDVNSCDDITVFMDRNISPEPHVLFEISEVLGHD